MRLFNIFSRGTVELCHQCKDGRQMFSMPDNCFGFKTELLFTFLYNTLQIVKCRPFMNQVLRLYRLNAPLLIDLISRYVNVDVDVVIFLV